MLPISRCFDSVPLVPLFSLSFTQLHTHNSTYLTGAVYNSAIRYVNSQPLRYLSSARGIRLLDDARQKKPSSWYNSLFTSALTGLSLPFASKNS